MSAESIPGLRDRFGSGRRTFRTWRGQRPFWAGLLTLLGGLPIMYFPYAHLTLGSLTVRMATTAGSGSLIIGVLLVVLGLTMWFQASARVFAGVAAILLSLVSLVVSNFGGFLIGYLPALIGGCLACAWAPARKATASAVPDGTAASVVSDEPAATGIGTDEESTNGRHSAG
ncbi:DUF6114 domain-containing protein [Streptantibioticus silvisoli]|uniref:DUF6114 domain-containing protein n=1 Tax=Streptantibioticus silvisoli TaxID=2705255 RepID=A0ABT6VZM5_9ACTN|nr:DUF6114 domain-containing protein [Streptantibioticus silvisoli]MDI5962721.1 DUF6114 domain-containing protein [Streptantibioticus silvisoli]